MYVYVHMYAAALTCFKENIVNYSRKLGKCTFEKFPLFLHGEVATWEIAAWKKTFGKIPNII